MLVFTHTVEDQLLRLQNELQVQWNGEQRFVNPRMCFLSFRCFAIDGFVTKRKRQTKCVRVILKGPRPMFTITPFQNAFVSTVYCHAFPFALLEFLGL